MTGPRHFDPGALRTRLSLDSIEETSDECGGVDISWNPVASIWANMRPLDAGTNLIADQDIEKLTHIITIRYREDIMSGWRFVLAERTFAIKSVHDPDERRAWLQCMTEELSR